MSTDTDNTVQEEGIWNPVTIPVTCDWQQGKALGACMGELLEKTLWTDVSFKCKDEKTEGPIKAHKIVLAARSPVFQAMFFGPCTDGKGEVDMPDASSETFRLFIRYLYCDAVDLTEETAFDVMEFAHLYQVSLLVQYCSVYLSSVISSSNACKILACGMLYNLDDLKVDCCSFIDNHTEEVLGSDGFMNISADCLLYLLKGDTLYAPETSILNAAENWSKRRLAEKDLDQTGTNIRYCLGESFFHLRLPTLSYKSLLENISRKGYLSVEEYADIAAFINKVPNVEVTTHHCVSRVPLLETVEVKPDDLSTVISKRICNIFEIYVRKDVALSAIMLGNIIPFLRIRAMYIDDYKILRSLQSITLSDYSDKAVKIEPVRSNIGQMGYLGYESTRKYNSTYNVSTLKVSDGVDLPQEVDPVLSGSLSINSSTHTFKLQQSCDMKANFRPPIVLKKKNSPYEVKLNVSYSCGGDVEIKTTSVKLPKHSCSLSGNVEIGSKSGSIIGIKSIEFLNVSNRA